MLQERTMTRRKPTRRREPIERAPGEATIIQMKRELRKVERMKGDGEEVGGTPFTILKFREPTISRLVSSGKIGGVELQAIDEIDRIFNHLCGTQILRGYEIRERLSPSLPVTPGWFVDAYERYRVWADQWSKRRVRNSDPSLDTVFNILFSTRSGKDIDDDKGWKHGTAITLFVNAVRDYAALAGWVDGNTAAKWSAVAREFYPLLRVRA